MERRERKEGRKEGGRSTHGRIGVMEGGREGGREEDSWAGGGSEGGREGGSWEGRREVD